MKNTKNKYLVAISQLQKNDEEITITKLAKILGISKQAVHYFLRCHNMLDVLPSSKNKKAANTILSELKKYDVSNMTVTQIQKLPIPELQAMSRKELLFFLNYRKVFRNKRLTSCKLEPLFEIDTANFTIEQLSKMIGMETIKIRSYLNFHKLPYKHVRNRKKPT